MAGDDLRSTPRRALPRTFGLAAAGAMLVASAAMLPAVGHGDNAGLQPAQSAVTFEDIARAENTLQVHIEQVRRVRETGTSGREWIAIREQLLIAPDPQTADQRFELGFLGIEGEPASPTELARRQQLYRRYAGYLHLYGSLRIDDPALAARNYVLLHLDDRVRLGRPTHRVALLPRRIGRSAWILEVDVETSYPLFRAEFDASGVLASSLEVTHFEQIDTLALDDVDWWKPSRIVEEFETVEPAAQSLSAAQLTIPETGELPAGYELFDVRIVREDLRPEASLVLTYSDGIDDIFVIETVNAPAPSLPAPTASGSAYAIFVYQDQNVAQLMFHTNSVTTLVIGRSGQFALASLAEQLLARSLQ